MSGIFPVKGFPMYDSLKMGVITLMEELAMELEGTNVGSAAFCPGPYSTNLGTSSQEVIKKHLGEDALPKMPARPAPPKDKDGKPLPMPKFEPPKDENGNPIDFSKLSRDPDDAGERVVRGIKRGDKFIFTHVDFKPGWELRMNAILRAFPDEKPTPGFATVFRGNVYNPIYEQQEQVPAFEFVKKD
jgi:short-subunit dehydrogenase